jgi:hypothetical protein
MVLAGVGCGKEQVRMRKLKALLFAAVFAMSVSTQASASIVTLVSGALGVSIGALPPIVFPNNSTPVVSVSSGGGSFTEPASIFTGSVMLPTALFTGVALINGLTIGNLANGTKVISQGQPAGPRGSQLIRAGGGLGGPGPLTGSAFVNVLGLFNLTVPLNIVGNTGATTSVAAGTLFVTVLGTGWTTGTVTITGVTTGSPATNTVINVGYDNRTPGHNGVVQLISPFKVITNAAGNLPGLATQTLTFIGAVPEPGTLLLVGSGVVGLMLYGGRRLRK